MNVNEILNTISCLPEEEQYFIADTLNKRIRELRRSQLAARGKQAEENYEQGHVTSGTVADLMSALDSDD
ncbi:MAG: hypothetical protein EWV55_24200 [Microcystis viridis Mv_BB_P_19951000_S69]|jgi:hypothetical protein|uniref:Uncharacterized protein n=4 Tax=Microcystis TaxID=1125 RepID=A0A552HC01_MICVR|nr:hypothetical protein [Microcystis aeruginosa]NCR09561.1 hypothetical protein [Microcystis aeruginosa LG13-11]NCS43496.1 hypothetical protein [Microcystis aeruginosa BS11-05]QGZ89564.1 hypothetical protein GQR42_08315 [Microcystis aeruginosa FD4]RPH86058.1 MAG: hypothetical protein EHM73_14500 [Chroococcales cyanobacterium metabat2.561]TRT76563.1 MAG: hypothetical protein EWV82_20950 [Microcystis aeruginosa Ma_AC_P_19900807_S299]TRU23352.1 MAG: hypothetical protein EWV81_16255 [Microcystis 